MGEGSGFTMSTLVKIILVVLVIFVASFAISELGAAEKIREFFPDFLRSENLVKWNEEYFINNPEIIVYEVKAKEADIYFRYDNDLIPEGERQGEDIGWRWSKDNVRWFSAENIDVSYARKTKLSVFMRNLHIFRGDIYLSKKNKDFVSGLVGKSPEEGLEDIVNRVLNNSEGNRFYNVKLFVYFNGVKIPKQQDYDVDSALLKDLDVFIDKLNQISYGVEKNAANN